MQWNPSTSPRRRFTPPRRLVCWIGGAVAAGLIAMAAIGQPPARAQSARPAPGEILKVFGLGGVLTADGTVWQYRPDQNEWLTIDDAFRAQGKETRILPLPVPAEEVREMATWGFLVTRAGDCWLYDIDRNRWQQLAPPGR